MKRTLYIECTCGCSGLVAHYDSELKDVYLEFTIPLFYSEQRHLFDSIRQLFDLIRTHGVLCELFVTKEDLTKLHELIANAEYDRLRCNNSGRIAFKVDNGDYSILLRDEHWLRHYLTGKTYRAYEYRVCNKEKHSLLKKIDRALS